MGVRVSSGRKRKRTPPKGNLKALNWAQCFIRGLWDHCSKQEPRNKVLADSWESCNFGKRAWSSVGLQGLQNMEAKDGKFDE